jgi:hypothetical protein
MKSWAAHFNDVSRRTVPTRTATFGATAPMDTVVVTEREDWRTGWLLPVVGALGFVVSWVGGYAAARAHMELERPERHALRHAHREFARTRRVSA